jgi:hypothetical protein
MASVTGTAEFQRKDAKAQRKIAFCFFKRAA